jgi:cardiolipin synthase
VSHPPATAPAAGDALARALDRACGGRAIPGNRVTHLCDGPEAYAAMLALIERAQQRLHLENYIVRDDATGRRFADALIAAAGRGVSVRVLYDHFGCRSTPRTYWRRLRRARIDVRPFNPLNAFRPLRSLRRDHRKYLAADGVEAVVGGLCIGDEWAGHPDTGTQPWRDTAVSVRGPAVPALEPSFLRKWAQAGGGAAERPLDGPAEPCGDAAVRVIDGVPGRLRLFQAMQLLVAGAAGRLWITDAYLVAPTPIYAGLIAAARDGVDVRLLLPGRTDVPAVRALTRVGYRELLEAGARIFEWHGPMLHAKTVGVDDVWFKVGSSNLNPSSLLSNHELDLLVEDRTLAAAATQQFRRDLAGAVEIVLRPRRVPERLATRLPPAVVPSAARAPGPRRRRDLRRRAAVTLAQVAGGARRSVGGALVFASVGTGILLLALPRLMAYLLAGAAFWLGAVAAWAFLRRRAYRGE